MGPIWWAYFLSFSTWMIFLLGLLAPQKLMSNQPRGGQKIGAFPSSIANPTVGRSLGQRFFFFDGGGGVNPLRLPNFLISSVRSIEKVLFSNSWILKVRNPSFISTKSHSLVCNSGTKEDIEDLYMYVCNRIHTVHLLFYGGILQYFLFYGGI